MAPTEKKDKIKLGQIDKIIADAQKDGRYVNVLHLLDIPFNLETKDAAWYYNNVHQTRNDLYNIYPEEPTAELAIEHIKKIVTEIKDWIELYKADQSDQLMKSVSTDAIKEICHEDFYAWMDVYDQSAFGSPLRKLALTHMLKVAKTEDEWHTIYDRSEIGSNIQTYCTQKLIEIAATKKRQRKDRITRRKFNRDEIDDLYERAPLYSFTKDAMTVNRYLALEEEFLIQEKEKEEERGLKKDPSEGL